jgi:glycerate dehydrogenase
MQKLKDMVIKILFIWKVEEKLQKYFTTKLDSYLGELIELLFIPSYSEEKALEFIEQVDMIVGWRPNKDLLLKAKNLKLFNNPGAGIQHLIPIFKEVNSKRINPVLLANCHGNSYFTAQHVIALLLAVTNKIIPHHNWMIEGKWRMGEEEGKSTPLRKRTIGLLGYGEINRKVHKFLAGFDVNFAICRRNWKGKDELLNNDVMKYLTEQLNEFLNKIDILIVAIPLTKETKGLITEKELKILGPKGIVINVGRGEIINQGDLFKALKNNELLGAGIDVWYNYDPEEKEGKKYPYNTENPFHELKNIVLSPHRGASPMDDLERWDDVIQNIKTLAEKKSEFKNVVDLDLEY